VRYDIYIYMSLGSKGLKSRSLVRKDKKYFDVKQKVFALLRKNQTGLSFR
jgi:hypothetical protein